MTDLFPAAAAIVFSIEGAYSNDPKDPGAETKWGVARAEHPEISAEAWTSWTKADSMAVMQRQYWEPHRCWLMPWPWALAVFDGEVNQGSVIKLAQTTLGLKADGIIGDESIAAMSNAPPELLDRFFVGRAFSYIADKEFPHDGKGWLKRLFAIRAAAALPPPTV